MGSELKIDWVQICIENYYLGRCRRRLLGEVEYMIGIDPRRYLSPVGFCCVIDLEIHATCSGGGKVSDDCTVIDDTDIVQAVASAQEDHWLAQRSLKGIKFGCARKENDGAIGKGIRIIEGNTGGQYGGQVLGYRR